MNRPSWEAMPDRFVDLLERNDNTICVDCGDSTDATWASLGFGVIVCLNCAGHHRSLGTHLTLVRSIKLDAWTDEHFQPLTLFGNARFAAYLSSLGDLQYIDDKVKRYSIPKVLYYR